MLGHIGRFDGIDPAGFTGCCNPTNVAIHDGIYTTEKAGPRVKAYDFSGKLLAVIATDLFDANCKNMDIAVDSRGPRLCRRYGEAGDLCFRTGEGMSEDLTRRDLFGTVARGTVLVALAGGAGFLVKKANGQIVWQVNASRCINSRLGEVGVEACNLLHHRVRRGAVGGPRGE